jgi:hypothetical protein
MEETSNTPSLDPDAVDEVMAEYGEPPIRRSLEEIMAVQPMMGPASLVYYLRWRYSTNSGGRKRTFTMPRIDWKKEGF